MKKKNTDIIPDQENDDLGEMEYTEPVLHPQTMQTIEILKKDIQRSNHVEKKQYIEPPKKPIKKQKIKKMYTIKPSRLPKLIEKIESISIKDNSFYDTVFTLKEPVRPKNKQIAPKLVNMKQKKKLVKKIIHSMDINNELFYKKKFHLTEKDRPVSKQVAPLVITITPKKKKEIKNIHSMDINNELFYKKKFHLTEKDRPASRQVAPLVMTLKPKKNIIEQFIHSLYIDNKDFYEKTFHLAEKDTPASRQVAPLVMTLKPKNNIIEQFIHSLYIDNKDFYEKTFHLTEKDRPASRQVAPLVMTLKPKKNIIEQFIHSLHIDSKDFYKQSYKLNNQYLPTEKQIAPYLHSILPKKSPIKQLIHSLHIDNPDFYKNSYRPNDDSVKINKIVGPYLFSILPKESPIKQKIYSMYIDNPNIFTSSFKLNNYLPDMDIFTSDTDIIPVIDYNYIPKSIKEQKALDKQIKNDIYREKDATRIVLPWIRNKNCIEKKTLLKFTYSIVIMNWKRKRNITKYIIPVLIQLPYINEILISNGNKESAIIPNHYKVRCFNHYGYYNDKYGLELRYITANQSKNNHVIIMDDDLICLEMSKMLKTYEKDHNKIVGLYGRCGSDGYSNDEHHYKTIYSQYKSEIILTRLMVFPKKFINIYFKYKYLCMELFNKGKPYGNGEDIVFSYLLSKYIQSNHLCINIPVYNLYEGSESISLGYRQNISKTVHKSYRIELCNYLYRENKDTFDKIILNNRSNIIITLNLGNRNFIKYTKPLMEQYATKIGADLKIISNYRSIYQYRVGNHNNIINNQSYIIKCNIIYDFLEYYDRVLYIDDTSCIHKDTPDIFNLVPCDHVGGFNEGKFSYLNSHKYDKSFIYKHTNYMIKSNHYINTGIMVYSKCHRSLFSDHMIQKYHILFSSKYPNQAFVNYVLQYNNIKMYFLPKSYNNMEITKDFNYLDKNKSRNISTIDPHFIKTTKNYIWHITGLYTSHREKIIKNICKVLQTDKTEFNYLEQKQNSTVLFDLLQFYQNKLSESVSLYQFLEIKGILNPTIFTYSNKIYTLGRIKKKSPLILLEIFPKMKFIHTIHSDIYLFEDPRYIGRYNNNHLFICAESSEYFKNKLKNMDGNIYQTILFLDENWNLEDIWRIQKIYKKRIQKIEKNWIPLNKIKNHKSILLYDQNTLSHLELDYSIKKCTFISKKNRHPYRCGIKLNHPLLRGGSPYITTIYGYLCINHIKYVKNNIEYYRNTIQLYNFSFQLIYEKKLDLSCKCNIQYCTGCLLFDKYIVLSVGKDDYFCQYYILNIFDEISNKKCCFKDFNNIWNINKSDDNIYSIIKSDYKTNIIHNLIHSYDIYKYLKKKNNDYVEGYQFLQIKNIINPTVFIYNQKIYSVARLGENKPLVVYTIYPDKKYITKISVDNYVLEDPRFIGELNNSLLFICANAVEYFNNKNSNKNIHIYQSILYLDSEFNVKDIWSIKKVKGLEIQNIEKNWIPFGSIKNNKSKFIYSQDHLDIVEIDYIKKECIFINKIKRKPFKNEYSDQLPILRGGVPFLKYNEGFISINHIQCIINGIKYYKLTLHKFDSNLNILDETIINKISTYRIEYCSGAFIIDNIIIICYGIEDKFSSYICYKISDLFSRKKIKINNINLAFRINNCDIIKDTQPYSLLDNQCNIYNNDDYSSDNSSYNSSDSDNDDIKIF